MGTIMVAYGRRFHLKFPDGTEKTYSAEELEFFPTDEMMADGGNIGNPTFVVKNLDGKVVLKTKSLNKASDYHGLLGRDTHTVETLDGRILSGSSDEMADGGEIGSGKNGYVAFYKGKKVDVKADSMYGAQKTAAKYFNAKKEYDVNVVLAEVDGKQYVQSTAFAKGGGFPSRGETVDSKDLNYDMLDYFHRTNKKLLIDTKTQKGIEGGVGKMYGDFVFNGDSIQKKDIVSVKILDDNFAQGGYMAKDENYEYVNTFNYYDSNVPVPQDDFEKLIDAYHKKLSGDKLDVAKYNVLKIQMGNYLGHKTVDKMEEYIEKTHNAHKMAKGGYVSKRDVEAITIINPNKSDSAKKYLTFKSGEFLNGLNQFEKGGKLIDNYTYIKRGDIFAVYYKDKTKKAYFQTTMEDKPKNGFWVSKKALIREGGKTPSKSSATFDAYESYDELSKLNEKVWDKLKIESGSEIYASDSLQKKLAIEYPNSGIDAKFKSLTAAQRKKVAEVMTDENEHSFRNYLTLRGYLGPKEYDSYEKLFDPKRRYVLNPDNFKNYTADKVKVGSILTTKTGVKVKVVEYNPQYGVKAIRLDATAADKPSQYVELSKFKGFEEVSNNVETPDEKANKLLNQLKEDGKLKRYFDTRGSGKKYFETIIPNKSEKGYYKRYESLSSTNIGTLQNEYLDEDDVLTWIKNSQKRIDAERNNKMASGGKIGFEALSKKVASRYAGKNVKPKYQNEYGKTYDKAEAKEVGDKVAAKVYRMQQGKMAMGGKMQGYNDRLDESLAERNDKITKMNATFKERRNESKGENKALGKRPYSSVSTMDKMASGGKIELPHELDRYFTKPAGTIEVEISKLIPIRARKSGIENAEVYMKKAYDGEMSKRKPIEIYKTRNKKYRVNDGNSTFAVAKKNGWETIYATVVSNPNVTKRAEKSTFTIAKEIRKAGESWSDAVKRVKENRK
jgi:hypothetical protein